MAQETKTQFLTAAAIQGKSPLWATYAFRTTIILTTAITIWLAGTKLVAEGNKFEITLVLKALDFVVWGLGRMFGIVKEDDK